MDAKNEEKIMSRIQEHLEAYLSLDYPGDWFGIFAQGSMNYDMWDEQSDIDTKLLYIPSFREVALNSKPVNKVYIMENDEHIDIKDIREYWKILRKQNINFMEILFTDYYIVNPKYKEIWDSIQRAREDIAHSNECRFMKCCVGMCLEKQHALEHPYPSKLDLLEKYHFDGKQLAHAIRIMDFTIRFLFEKQSYKECLTPLDNDFLMDIKRNRFPKDVEEARIRMSSIVGSMKKLEEKFCSTHKDILDPIVDELLDEYLIQILAIAYKEN